MDKNKIIEKYKKLKDKEKLLITKSGETVIGNEVDENNQLWYVLEKDGNITVEKAENKRISQILWKNVGTKVTIKQKNN